MIGYINTIRKDSIPFGKTEFKDTEVIELFSLSDGFRVLTSSRVFILI